MTPDDLPALLVKLQGATEGAQELDARIMCALVAPAGAYVERSEFNGVWCVYEPRSTPSRAPRLWEGNSGRWHRPDRWPVTRSLDAALALVERLLPGVMWRLGFDPDDGSYKAELVTAAPECTKARANHDTPPMALLCALLPALTAQQKGEEG